jgi:hypothetical protein
LQTVQNPSPQKWRLLCSNTFLLENLSLTQLTRGSMHSVMGGGGISVHDQHHQMSQYRVPQAIPSAIPSQQQQQQQQLRSHYSSMQAVPMPMGSSTGMDVPVHVQQQQRYASRADLNGHGGAAAQMPMQQHSYGGGGNNNHYEYEQYGTLTMMRGSAAAVHQPQQQQQQQQYSNNYGTTDGGHAQQMRGNNGTAAANEVGILQMEIAKYNHSSVTCLLLAATFGLWKQQRHHQQ